jgi:hypothetical protein
MGGRDAAKQLSTISQGFAQQIALDRLPAHPYSEQRAKISGTAGLLPLTGSRAIDTTHGCPSIEGFEPL